MKQGDERADQGRRQREHDGEGVDERVELARQQHVDDEHRETEGEEATSPWISANSSAWPVALAW